MPPHTETPGADELEEYLNGTLPAARRLAVAEFLAADADTGARLLADQAQTERLRAALRAALPPPPVALTAAANRVTNAMTRDRRMRWLRPAAAAVACFVLGWGGMRSGRCPAARRGLT